MRLLKSRVKLNLCQTRGNEIEAVKESEQPRGPSDERESRSTPHILNPPHIRISALSHNFLGSQTLEA